MNDMSKTTRGLSMNIPLVGIPVITRQDRLAFAVKKQQGRNGLFMRHKLYLRDPIFENRSEFKFGIRRQDHALILQCRGYCCMMSPRGTPGRWAVA